MAKARNEPDISRNAPGISKIGVRGYKCFRDYTEIEIKPLTILAGANNSGKSSIIQPLLLLKQTLDSTSDPGALLLNGPHVPFTSAEQFLWRPPGRGPVKTFAVSMNLDWDLDGDVALDVTFEAQKGGNVDLLSNRCHLAEGLDIELKRGMTSNGIKEHLETEVVNFGNEWIEDALKEMFTRYSDLKWRLHRDRWAFRVAVGPFFDVPWLLAMDGDGTHEIARHLQSLMHLPGMRGNPQRQYPKHAVGKYWPGPFHEYTASVIDAWQQDKDECLVQLRKQLKELGLTSKIEVKALNAAQYEIRVARLLKGQKGGRHDMVNIADVGFGVSQVLPVLVALLQARPGQIVYLEEPEIHLHPNAQRVLAGILADAALRGVKVVAETHSALLLREIATLIAKGAIKKEQVAMYWFQRGEDGAATVHTADLDDNGAWGDWPQDFDEIEREADMAYLDQVELRGK